MIQAETIDLHNESILNGNSLCPEFNIEIVGRVNIYYFKVGNKSVKNTLVRATFCTGDDNSAKKMQSEGRIGTATISEDVINFTQRSFIRVNPLAGIKVSIILTKDQFFQFSDHLALGNSTLLIHFFCNNQMDYPLKENEEEELELIGYRVSGSYDFYSKK